MNGGPIVVDGTPETMADVGLSATGQYLRPILEPASGTPRVVQMKPKRPARSLKVAMDEDEADLIAAK